MYENVTSDPSYLTHFTFLDAVQLKISAGTGLYNGMTTADYYQNGSPTDNTNDICAVRPSQICTRPYLNVIRNPCFQKVIM